jgi:hypothetical protein
MNSQVAVYWVLVSFFTGAVVTAVLEFFFFKNNPKIEQDLQERALKGEAEAIKYKALYDGLYSAIKDKAQK